MNTTHKMDSGVVALSPDDILDRIKVDSPKDSITVKGTVTRLNPYPKDKPMWMYGDLLGVERSIGFRCRYDEAPKEEGEHIVLTGFLSVKARN